MPQSMPVPTDDFTDPRVNALVTEVSFCLLPLDDFEASSWTIKVAWRGPGDRYAVVDRCGRNLSRTGKWHFESNPSSRTDTFKRRHRFTYAEACSLATEEAAKVTVMGMTVDDLRVWREAIDQGMTREQANTVLTSAQQRRGAVSESRAAE